MPEPIQSLSVVESTGLRRKDTTKGPPLRILSLDGGGVRGYSMLILLQELMHRTFVEIHGRAPKRHEIPKPCEHFDLIAGTGTGGLIAIMLGRLRLDLETCKDVYVRMTKRVFETDKTIAGIPYRSTLFKASKLEEAIRECVREHTLNEAEGKDDTSASDLDLHSTLSPRSSVHSRPQRSMSNSSRYSQIGMAPVNMRGPYAAMRWGNPNALLYDNRENRTKTAVTAVFKGTKKNGKSTLLRSYDSRAEPPPEFECTIWQAGRATSATGLAFKPIQIGQSVFIDEGAGKYNPAPRILDEAVNEWPGRDVGVFISIGTGKRPNGTSHQKHLWWEGFIGSGMGDFAEARRRLIAKIEGCEDTHQYMRKEYLQKHGVNQENYYRLNVEVGVGEFGMNEWNRLAEISTSTRQYLTRDEVQSVNMNAAEKLGRIHRARVRWERAQNAGVADYTADSKWDRPLPPAPGDSYTDSYTPPSNPIAVELPAEDVVLPVRTPQTPQANDFLSPSSPRNSGFHPLPAIDDNDKYAVISSDEYPQPVDFEKQHWRRNSGDIYMPYRGSNGSFVPTPGTPRRSDEDRRPATATTDGSYRRTPPPLPPKTPLPYPDENNVPMSPMNRPMSPDGGPMSPTHGRPLGPLPYPDLDGPPPMVNMARKPAIGR